jgi:POT family proton-dependent oligopeptide transporter
MSAAKFPRAIKFIMWNEAAERFTFYGMKAILTTYLVTQFFNPGKDPAINDAATALANEKTHLFISLAYAASVIGAFMADWFIGKYKTILYLSVIYCIGIFCQAAFADNYPLFMLGLYTIALGSGGIKPCVSANVGDQFDASNAHLIEKAFSLFYFCINFGSFFSTLLIPVIFQRFGATVAFGIPGILMAIATIVFVMGNKQYVKVPPSGYPKENFVLISMYALSVFLSGKKGSRAFLDTAKEKYSDSSVEGIKAAWRILGIFAFIPVFWALYDQNSSEWVLQATHLDLSVFGYTLLAQQVQAVNPILILTFIPIFTFVIFPGLEKKGITISPLLKIGLGFVFTILSFVVIYFLQASIGAGGRPTVGWQMLAYFILTIGEVLISITGLEYAYSQSPKKMKSTVMAFWLLTVATGNYFVSLINKNIAGGGFLSGLHGATYYLFFIAVLSVTTILYFLYIRSLKKIKDIG